MDTPDGYKDGYKFDPVKFLLWLPAYVVIAFAIYVLSTGPFYWTIFQAFFIDEHSLIALLYSPLAWLSGRSDLFARWMEWYIGLWVL